MGEVRDEAWRFEACDSAFGLKRCMSKFQIRVSKAWPAVARPGRPSGGPAGGVRPWCCALDDGEEGIVLHSFIYKMIFVYIDILYVTMSSWWHDDTGKTWLLGEGTGPI